MNYPDEIITIILLNMSLINILFFGMTDDRNYGISLDAKLWKKIFLKKYFNSNFDEDNKCLSWREKCLAHYKYEDLRNWINLLKKCASLKKRKHKDQELRISDVENIKIIEFGANLKYKCELITKIPSNIKYLINLKTIAINTCSLREIPSSINSLLNLEKIDFQNNDIKKININNELQTKLTHVNLSNNSINEFLISVKNLKYLDLNNNEILKMPINMCSLSKIEYLNLNDNLILEISVSILNLKNLKELYLCNNNIKYADLKIFKLKMINLKVLDISNNEDLKINDDELVCN